MKMKHAILLFLAAAASAWLTSCTPNSGITYAGQAGSLRLDFTPEGPVIHVDAVSGK